MEKRRSWTRSELVVAFYQYCVTPFGKIHNRNHEIIKLSEKINRTPNALAMKMCNFASFDPVHQKRNVKGLANAAKADKSIWEEFHDNLQGLLEVYQLQAEGLHIEQDQPKTLELPELTETTRKVKVRVAQNFFRRSVLASYDNHCAICRLNNPWLLNASHIIPWATDESLRANPRNGLSLCTLHDRAFDRGLITLDQDMKLVLSGRLKKSSKKDNSSVNKAAFIELEGDRILLPDRFLPLLKALEYHRNNIFEKDRKAS